MTSPWTWLRRLLLIGTDAGMDRGLARTIKLTNVFVLFCFVFGIVTVPINYSYKHPAWDLWASLQLPALLGYLLVFWLNYQRRHLAAVICFMCIAGGYLAAGTIVTGRSLGIQWLFTSMTIMPFLVFPKEHLLYAVVFAGIALIASITLELNVQDGPLVGPPYQPGFAARIAHFRILNLAILLCYLGFYCRRTTVEAEEALEAEQRRSESLLLNILPLRIVEQLKDSPSTIANAHDQVTILFADIVGFTMLNETLPAKSVVELLNVIFTAFDQIMRQYGIEKIKTIGDAYMAVAGAPEPRKDHAQCLANAAVDMVKIAETFVDSKGNPVELRIGMNSGPVIAGVIGVHKFAYDLWGDTVNTASRMESHGEAGKIQVTEATYVILKNDFEFAERGVIDVKGKGKLRTWWLVGRRGAEATAKEV